MGSLFPLLFPLNPIGFEFGRRRSSFAFSYKKVLNEWLYDLFNK